jgi:hypothetical protein
MTMGFENHTNEQVAIWTGSGNLYAFPNGDGKLTVRVNKGVTAIDIDLSRQEAIYLRNRLTAFIESEIDGAAFREW